MDKDLKKLEMLYDATCKERTDILVTESLTVENNWDFIWDRYMLCKIGCYQLYESLELTSHKQEQDIYELIIADELKFKVVVNFIPKQKIASDIMMLSYQFGNNEDIKSLTSTFNKTKNSIMHVYFEDEDQQTKLTGLVRNYSFAVFGGVSDAIQTSKLKRFDDRPDIMFVHLNKMEPKRLNVYKKFFKDSFVNFDKMFVNEHEGERYSSVWFWKSKIEDE